MESSIPTTADAPQDERPDEEAWRTVAQVEALVRRPHPSAGSSNEDQAAAAATTKEEEALEAELTAAWAKKEAEQEAALEAKHAADKKAAEKARMEISDEAIKECGIRPDDEYLESLEGLGIRMPGLQLPVKVDEASDTNIPRLRRRDFFGSLLYAPELLMELAKHLRPKDLVSLYAISKDFHGVINGHLSHCMKRCSQYQAFESAIIFRPNVYQSLTILDPVGRPNPVNPTNVRRVPSLRWLQMVVHRERTVRDILACLARKGHRVPPGTSMSLKKMWLTMDVSTTARRAQIMHNEKFWTDKDIFNIQLFVVKLDMRFNDPIDGNGDETLRKLLLGQRGLTPLSKTLKRTAFTSKMEVLKAAIRYAYKTRPEHANMPMFDIPPAEIGIGHLEGWGKGRAHLSRIDELVPREAVRRRLNLKDWIMHMMLYGYVDTITGKDTPPTAEEIYMSEDEEYHEEPNEKLDLKFPVQTYRDANGKTVMTG